MIPFDYHLACLMCGWFRAENFDFSSGLFALFSRSRSVSWTLLLLLLLLQLLSYYDCFCYVVVVIATTDTIMLMRGGKPKLSSLTLAL